MSASPIQENACPSCGAKLPSEARFCPACGTPAGEALPLETGPGPVAHERVERRWLGIPARFLLLCLGFAAFGAAVGLFASGSWGWGFGALLAAAVLFAVLAEAARQGGSVVAVRSSRLAAEGRAQAASTAEVWRTRLDTRLTRRRTQSRLDRLEFERAHALQALGDAAWRDDEQAERQARSRLEELDGERGRLEEELAQRLAGADERIRLARLPVQDTMMVEPSEPHAPYPPPDEGNPPQPAQVPEPYPPPDEGTPPTPAPDPGRTEND